MKNNIKNNKTININNSNNFTAFTALFKISNILQS